MNYCRQGLGERGGNEVRVVSDEGPSVQKGGRSRSSMYEWSKVYLSRSS